MTGVGIQCPLGSSINEFTQRMFAGDSGVKDIGDLLPSHFPVTIAGVLDKVVIAGAVARDLSKFYETVLALEISSADQAISSLASGSLIDSIVYGSIPSFHLESILGLLNSPADIFKKNFGQGSAPDHFCDKIAEYCESKGFGHIPQNQRVCINTACTSGGQAIGIAFENIRSGKWKRCLVMGSDWRPIESGIMGFYALNALSISKEPARTVSRPFDKERSGVVRSQGGAAMILESLQSNASPGLAEVSGYCSTIDAYRLTDGREDVLCLTEAMRGAISCANLRALNIDYINAHGTSTRLNDRLETKAIKEVFGDRAYQIPISSLKSQIGHTIAGAGIIESIASIIMIQHQKVAPTINYNSFDPECDLDYVPNLSRSVDIRHLLKNSLAFGGHNVSLIFSRIQH